MRVRIYYNRSVDYPLIWSYDQGTQETEIQISGWRLHGLDAADGSDLTVPTGDREHPRVWIELKDVRLTHMRDDVLHVYGY